MKLTLFVIKVQLIYLILAFSSVSQAQDKYSIEELNAANEKLNRMAQICQSRVKLNRITNNRDDPQYNTIAGCARICGILAKNMTTASSKQRSNLMEKVPQCEKLFNSLSEEYQQDVSALVAAQEKQEEEKHAVDITELGDVQGRLRSLGPLASSRKTAVLETTHAEFNTLCRGRAGGIADGRGRTRDQMVILKSVQYRKYKNKPDAKGSCKFNEIVLIK